MILSKKSWKSQNFQKISVVFGVFRYKNKPLDGCTGQNLQALDQMIDLRGHSLLYNDVLLTFKPAEATFSAPKIGIFWGQNSAGKKKFQKWLNFDPKKCLFLVPKKLLRQPWKSTECHCTVMNDPSNWSSGQVLVSFGL